jgi:hypothetical protein
MLELRGIVHSVIGKGVKQGIERVILNLIEVSDRGGIQS